MRSSNRPNRTAPLIFLGVLVAFGIAGGVWQKRLRTQNRNSPLLAPVSAALVPFQKAAANVQKWASSPWSVVFRGRELERENARLRAENALLLTQNESGRNAQSEAIRLRGLLHYQASPQSGLTLAAPVIAWLPSRAYDTITVGAGTRSGVKQKSIARTPQGLVGQVIEANPLSAQVLLLTDLQSGVGALVKRNGKTKSDGIVQGTGRGNLLEMVDLKHEDDVAKGDVVVSSGYGGVIPPGVPIGIVQSVSEDATHYLKVARILPFAPVPGDLRDVLLIAPQNQTPTGEPLPLPTPKPTPTPTPKPLPTSAASPKPSPAAAPQIGRPAL